MTIASITFEHEGAELIPGTRSYVYRMLATAFSYPSDQLCEDIASGGWSRTLTQFANHLPFRLPIPQETSCGSADRTTLQEGYVSIFEVGTGRPFCPLYEGSHRRGRMKLLEELVRFYEHFGLKIQPGDHPKHLSAELEFMHYMTFKEAAFIAHYDSADDLRRAQHDFLDRHLCKWLPRMRERLLSAPGLPPFYSFAADLADGFCSRDLAWLKTGGEMPHP